MEKLELAGEVSVSADLPTMQVKLATSRGNFRLIGIDPDVRNGSIRNGDTIRVTVLTAPGSTATNHVGRLAEATVPSGHATSVRRPSRVTKRVLASTTPETHNVTLVRATWDGTPISDAPTLAEGREALSQASAYWLGQSADAIKMVRFDVQDNVILSMSQCDPLADPLAEIQRQFGWKPWTASHIVLLVPPCGGEMEGTLGRGTVGFGRTYGGFIEMFGPPSVRAGSSGYRGGTLAHELGHNLSLGHSQEVICEDTASTLKVPNSDPVDCVNNTYQGAYSVMGNPWEGYAPPAITGHEAFILGLTGSASLTNLTIAGLATQTVALAPVGSGDGMRFLRVADTSGNTYYLEYRAAVGQDKPYLTAPSGVRAPSGVIVTKAFAQPWTSFNVATEDAKAKYVDSVDTYLLDAQPTVNPFSANPWISHKFEGEPTLKPGTPLVLGDINVTVDSETSASATVRIVYEPVPPMPTAPTAPRGVKAKTDYVGGVWVTWDAPSSNGGATITRYQVTASPGGVTCISPGTVECMVRGLVVGQTYTFTVRATNSAGVSAASEASDPVTIPPAASPTAMPTPTPVPTYDPVPVDYPTEVASTPDVASTPYVASEPTSTLASTGTRGVQAIAVTGVVGVALGLALILVARRKRTGHNGDVSRK